MSGKVNTTWWDTGTQSGWIHLYEREMIRFMEHQYGELTAEEKICATFVSLFLKAGHTCLPVNLSPIKWAQILGIEPEESEWVPEDPVDRTVLEKSKIVGADSEMKPFILYGNLLSFRKNYLHEDFLVQWFNKKIKNFSIPLITSLHRDHLNALFPEQAGETDWQRCAAALSMIKPFLIISGGPGTGKTTTVAKILALHLRLSNGRFRVALAAPTGKAAGRMGEALRDQLIRIGLTEEELRQLPDDALTVHRLLSGTLERGLLPPVEKKLLRYDLVIVDEASMIDLTLMYRLVTHLAPDTKLILLGDRDQLASVEAGSVFSDICQKRENSFQKKTLSLLKQAGFNHAMAEEDHSPLDDSIVYLTKSYRFSPDSGIGKLAGLVKNKTEEALDFRSVFDESAGLNYSEFGYEKADFDKLMTTLSERFIHALPVTDPDEMLSFWKQLVWLGVLRKGLTGTDRLNRLAEWQIAARHRVEVLDGWYHGRPVLITQNDYSLGVFNGDLGVCLRDGQDAFWVYIESGSSISRVRPQRLVHYEPAYFLTVHKSQGSEFEQVNLLLPKTDTPILTRELIYTAITRAKTTFSLFGSLQLFEKGLKRNTVRYTGLKEKLNHA